MFRTRKSLKAEINLLTFQLEEIKKEKENLEIRNSILEGQVEDYEELQIKASNRLKNIEELTKNRDRLLVKIIRISQSLAAYRYKYGNLTKAQFAEFKDHEKRAEEQ